MAIKNWASAIAFLSNIETDPNRRAIISNEAELTARRAPEGYFRVEALTAIISYLPEPQRTEVFEDTVRLARTLPTGNNRTHALVRLAALASPDRRQDVVVEAIEAFLGARRNRNPVIMQDNALWREGPLYWLEILRHET